MHKLLPAILLDIPFPSFIYGMCACTYWACVYACPLSPLFLTSLPFSKPNVSIEHTVATKAFHVTLRTAEASALTQSIVFYNWVCLRVSPSRTPFVQNTIQMHSVLTSSLLHACPLNIPANEEHTPTHAHDEYCYPRSVSGVSLQSGYGYWGARCLCVLWLRGLKALQLISTMYAEVT